MLIIEIWNLIFVFWIIQHINACFVELRLSHGEKHYHTTNTMTYYDNIENDVLIPPRLNSNSFNTYRWKKKYRIYYFDMNLSHKAKILQEMWA